MFAMTAPLGASTYLHRLDSIDKSDIDCGCTFFRSKAEGETELYLAGSEVVFFDFTGDPPRALINFGQGNVEFYLEERSPLPFNTCEPGEPFSSEWRLDERSVSTHLVAAVADGAACWFDGRLRVEQSGSGVGSADISGACQC